MSILTSCWTEQSLAGLVPAMTRYRVRWLYIHCRGDLVTRLGSGWATAYDCCRPCCWPNRRYFHVSPLAQQLHGWDEQGECGAQLPFSAQDFQKRSTKLDLKLSFSIIFGCFSTTFDPPNVGAKQPWTMNHGAARPEHRWPFSLVRVHQKLVRNTSVNESWCCISQFISVIDNYKVLDIYLYIYFTFLREFDMFDVELVDDFSWWFLNYCKLLLCIYTCIKVIRQLYVYVIMSLYVTMWNIIICSIIMMNIINIIFFFFK